MTSSHTGRKCTCGVRAGKHKSTCARYKQALPGKPAQLFELRMQVSLINDRLSALKSEAEALLAKRAPIERAIAKMEDALTDELVSKQP